MLIKSFNLILVVTTGAFTLLAVSGMMCQKSQTEKTEAPQEAVADKTLVHDTMMNTGMGAPTDTSYNKAGAATEYYTCTMHPQVHQTKPGKCPICGMSLVFQKADKSKVK